MDYCGMNAHPSGSYRLFSGSYREEQIKTILGIMNETYERPQPHKVELVDAFFFENSSLFADFLSREKTSEALVIIAYGQRF
jgi:hypothetical protein